jgi:hypothetical protein
VNKGADLSKLGCTSIWITVAAFIRVSTRDQRHTSQRAEVERWLKAQHLTDVTWFEDKESGGKMGCRGLNALEDAIFAGEVKTVVVWKLDRVARSWLRCHACGHSATPEPQAFGRLHRLSGNAAADDIHGAELHQQRAQGEPL